MYLQYKALLYFIYRKTVARRDMAYIIYMHTGQRGAGEGPTEAACVGPEGNPSSHPARRGGDDDDDDNRSRVGM